MNDIVKIIQEGQLNLEQSILALILLIVWTRFCMNMLLRLAERVGIMMTDGDMPSPISTGINDEVSLFTPNPCIECSHKQDWKTFIPFMTFFRDHEKGCKLSSRKSQRKIFITEIVFLILSLIVVILCYISHSQSSIMIIAAYSLTIPLSLFDLNFHWIPDRFSITFLLLGLLASPFSDIHQRILGSCVFAGLMTLSFLVSGIIRRRDVSSSGDVIMMAGAGAWLGTSHILFFGVGVIIIYGVMAIEHMGTAKSSDQEEISSALPLGPAIMGGGIISMLFSLF